MPMTSITVRTLPKDFDVLAPDGSEVRILASSDRGSMAHFKLQPGQVSVAVAHRTVEEIWYIVAGTGRMWCSYDNVDEVTPLHPGVSIAIPVGVHFQFRCDGDTALEAVGVTMPPWPGMDEAYEVEGKW
jgi:mannose-6-phosphate isomerase-like protein (cupin superfamily)